MELRELNEKLRKNIRFTKDDLAFNKQGILSSNQIEQIKGNIYFDKKTNIKLWGAIMFFSILIALARGVPLEALFYIFFMMAVFPVGHFLHNRYQLQKIIRGKIKVESIKGKVTLFYDEAAMQNLSKVRGGGMVQKAMNFSGKRVEDYAYAIQVGAQKIYTDKTVYEAFENQKDYCVYFIRLYKTVRDNVLLSAIIVSAEAL